MAKVLGGLEIRALVQRVAERGRADGDGDLLAIAATLHGVLLHGGELVRSNATVCDLLEAALDLIEKVVPPETPVDDTINSGQFVVGVRKMLSEYREVHTPPGQVVQ